MTGRRGSHQSDSANPGFQVSRPPRTRFLVFDAGTIDALSRTVSHGPLGTVSEDPQAMGRLMRATSIVVVGCAAAIVVKLFAPT